MYIFKQCTQIITNLNFLNVKFKEHHSKISLFYIKITVNENMTKYPRLKESTPYPCRTEFLILKQITSNLIMNVLQCKIQSGEVSVRLICFLNMKIE